MNKRQGRGFTIVELLIVIVVIGILASIVIVAFNGVQNRAKNSGRLSELKNWEKIINVYVAFNRKYPPVPAYGDYCLGTDFPKAAEINAAMAGVPSTNPITLPGNSMGYCRDIFYSSSRHSPNANLQTELATVGTLPGVKKTMSDVLGAKAVGPYMTVQASGVILRGVFYGESGECPGGTEQGYAYPAANDDTIICYITMPQAEIVLAP